MYVNFDINDFTEFERTLVAKWVETRKPLVPLDLSKEEYGSRWKDNDRITHMFFGEVVYRRLTINLMTGHEMDALIDFCIHDSAKADYWYTYEKDWGEKINT